MLRWLATTSRPATALVLSRYAGIARPASENRTVKGLAVRPACDIHTSTGAFGSSTEGDRHAVETRFCGIVLFVLALIAGMTAVASAAPGGSKGDRLEMYKATVDAAAFQKLQAGGYDIASVRDTAAGKEVALVLTNGERDRLRGQGVRLSVYRDKNGRSQSQRAALEAAGGFTVWRSYDEPGGIRDEMYQLARQNPQLLKLEVLGKTAQGREYIALKLTQGARDVPDGSRPAVLYVATHHAREWISTEVDRRLLHWYIDRWRANDKTIKTMLKNTELWFVLVHNPDGYQYTFDVERLWRKNLRDNNDDGRTTSGDGVDPNRNYSEHWSYDNEGSSSLFPSETYRGPAPESEPETKAMVEPVQQGALPVRDQLPLVRPAAALPAGLADADTLGRRPHLRGAHREGHRPGGARLQPRRVGRPVHDEWRVH